MHTRREKRLQSWHVSVQKLGEVCKFLDDIVYTLGGLLTKCTNSYIHFKQFLNSSTVKRNDVNEFHFYLGVMAIY